MNRIRSGGAFRIGDTTESSQATIRANRRETLLWTGASVVLLATLALVVMLGVYAFPTSKPVEIGHVEDFPPSLNPRLITVGDQQIYVVSIDGEIIAFDRRSPHATRCRVEWMAALNQFVDRCIGVYFAIDGTLISGPAARNLDRYPVTIGPGGTVWVDTVHSIQGAPHRNEDMQGRVVRGYFT